MAFIAQMSENHCIGELTLKHALGGNMCFINMKLIVYFTCMFVTVYNHCFFLMIPRLW